MTKDRLRMIIGENVRNERTARNISMDELSEMLELSPGFVGLIERGHRGTTPITLYKLADVFGISIDELFYSPSLSFSEERAPKDQANRKKIDSLIVDFSEKELEFVVSVLKGVRAMNRSKVESDLDESDLDETEDDG